MDDSSLQVKNNELTKKNLLTNLFTKCHTCSLRHNCEFHRERIESAHKEILAKKQKIEELRSKSNNDVNLYKQTDAELNDFIRLIWKKFDESVTNIECTYEKGEVVEAIKGLQQMYNLTDYRIAQKVRLHLQTLVLNQRAFKEASRQSLITYRTTEDGSRIPIVNPILYYHGDTIDRMDKLINSLDKITKEDELLDEIKTSGHGFYTKYLSKIPAGKVIDVTPSSSNDDKESEKEVQDDISTQN
jgi:transcriptional regulator with PAS, ATPase and Fis domain